MGISLARFDANSNHGEFQFQGNQNSPKCGHKFDAATMAEMKRLAVQLRQRQQAAARMGIRCAIGVSCVVLLLIIFLVYRAYTRPLLVLSKARSPDLEGEFPGSRFLRVERVFLRGSEGGLQGWCDVCGRKDGSLPTSITKGDEHAFLELDVLVRNMSRRKVTISARDMLLKTKEGKLLKVYDGDKAEPHEGDRGCRNHRSSHCKVAQSREVTNVCRMRTCFEET